MLRARAPAPLFSLLAVGFTCGFSAPAQAGIINTFDAPGDVVTSPTQVAGTWYTDRYAPASFASGLIGGGRNGVLGLGISSADSEANRPGAFSSSFYNTQGRKFDLAAGTTSLFIDMFVPTGFNTGRYAGLWGTAVDEANAVTDFPIVEFANGGFRTWNGGVTPTGWDNVTGTFATNQWYEVGFVLNGGQFDYYINGQLTGTTLNSATSVGLANVILQGHNTQTGANYTAYFDNLSTTTSTPEPATMATLGLLAVGVGLRYRRRKASVGGEQAAA